MSHIGTEYRVRVVVETREIRQRDEYEPVTRSRWVKTGIDTKSLHSYENQETQFVLYDRLVEILRVENQEQRMMA